MDENQENNQDEMEQKISDAEMEAQPSEIAPEEEARSSFEAEPVERMPEEKPETHKELSRARKIWRRTLIWLVVVAIAFAGGFFLDTQMRYKPAVQQRKALQTELENAESEIEALEAEIERLNLFEERNISLTEELESQQTHLILLSARTAVADAALAVEQDRTADARLFLDKVGSSLESLKETLTTEQGEVIDSMIQRHQLIMIDLENGGFTVSTDLEVLSNRLINLENTLFATP